VLLLPNHKHGGGRLGSRMSIIFSIWSAGTLPYPPSLGHLDFSMATIFFLVFLHGIWFERSYLLWHAYVKVVVVAQIP
jgi:hypothetical protein